MPRPTQCSCDAKQDCPLYVQIEQLEREVERLSGLVNMDILTGLFNYRHFTRALAQETERSKRTLQPTSLIILDADHFKSVNDQWGHEAGNQALKLISNCILHNIRKLDIACRYGGEEFAIILPGTDLRTGKFVAERVRKAIEETPLFYQKEKICITASAGISTYSGKQDIKDISLIEAADQQLYKAKQQGRNQTCATIEKHAEKSVSYEEKSALVDVFDKSNKDKESS